MVTGLNAGLINQSFMAAWYRLILAVSVPRAVVCEAVAPTQAEFPGLGLRPVASPHPGDNVFRFVPVKPVKVTLARFEFNLESGAD